MFHRREAQLTFNITTSLLRFTNIYVTGYLSAQTGSSARKQMFVFTVTCRDTPACLFNFYGTVRQADTFIYPKNKYVAKATEQQVMVNVWFLLVFVC